MTVSITALILAGGQSSRMGEDKALVKWQNQPLLRIVCDVALTACPAVYILTPWPDRYRSIVPSDCHLLLESQPHRGPLVALAEGISQLPPCDWVWLLACDLPRLDRKIVQNWLNILGDIPDSTLAVVPYHDGYFEPLCGFYRGAIAPYLQAFQQTGGRSFQQFLQEIPTHKLTLNDPEVLTLWNCNTPADVNYRTVNQRLPVGFLPNRPRDSRFLSTSTISSNKLTVEGKTGNNTDRTTTNNK